MNYEQLLRKSDLKVTPQRLGILSLMHDMGHVSIEDLYEKIQKQFSSISLATLYKNVNAMLEKAIVKEVKVPHQKSRYEITKAPHAHIMCEQCGRFEDIAVDMGHVVTCIDGIIDFDVKETNLIFSGICSHCRK